MTADQKAYADLLTSKLPHVIENEGEYERYLADVEELMRRGDLSPAEEQLLQLLALLIEKFESERFEAVATGATEILKALMVARDVAQSDLARLIGSKGNTSEILSGKRSVSKSQARKLGDFFNVPPHLFLGF